MNIDKFFKALDSQRDAYSSDLDKGNAFTVGYLKGTLEAIAIKYPEVDEYLNTFVQQLKEV
jgi:hypothetical protein